MAKPIWYKNSNSIVFFPVDKRDSHKLFEPKERTNFKVGNWSRYCTVTENTNFCKIWIGIKWNGTNFVRESDNQPINWANFKHSENFVYDHKYHGCKYQTTRWLRSKPIKGKILGRYFHFVPSPIPWQGQRKGVGRGDSSTKFFGRYINPISIRGSRLRPPYRLCTLLVYQIER